MARDKKLRCPKCKGPVSKTCRTLFDVDAIVLGCEPCRIANVFESDEPWLSTDELDTHAQLVERAERLEGREAARGHERYTERRGVK